MTPLANPPTNAAALDEDLAKQARPGHGIPSQDPSAAAQMPMEPGEAEREANSAYMGGGIVAGAATGAAIGIAVAGPVGVVAGATLGAVAGALGGAAAGSMANAGHGHGDPEGTDPASTTEVRLHIEDSGGDGRPVVLIHGWPLSAQSWEHQVDALRAAGHRVVAYDRRGFGRSDKPDAGYSYDTLADDLQHVIESCGLEDVTLVGFSMGGGEVARYITRFGDLRLRSVVFAAAVTPYLLKNAGNPEGPLSSDKAGEMKAALEQDRAAFFDQFTRDFFSADGKLQVSETQRTAAVAMCQQSAQHAAVACMESFAGTDFRDDLLRVKVPALVIHGMADGIVPFEGSGQRTHRAIGHSEQVTVDGAPHGFNVSHATVFNDALIAFLRR
jgi:non-heme chloroperoxidase